MTLQELRKQFLEHLEIEKNRSPKTVENYNRYLQRFLTLTQAEKPSDITLEAVRKFRLALNRLGASSGKGEGEGALKKQTQFYHLIALRSFLKYLAKRDIAALSAEKVELGRMPERELEVMEAGEIERLLVAPKGNSLSAFRDRALLELLFSTGLRVSEAARLNRDSINLKQYEFSVKGKGGKIRIVFLSDRAKRAIGEYLEKRQDPDEPLFIHLKKGSAEDDESARLTARSIQRLVRKYAIAAGISKKITPHGLRHSFATDLLQNGADIRAVQQLLGHAQITTTQIYTHVTDKTLREVHKRYHARNRS